MEENTKITYPYRDSDFGFWVYEKLPKGVVPAQLKDLYIGRTVIYQARLEPLKGKWIVEQLTKTSFPIARGLCMKGKLYIKKG